MSSTHDAPLPEASSLKAVSSLFGVLSHPDRLRILSLLRQAEMDVTTLHTTLGLSQSGVSQHLVQLRNQGLVGQRRDGKHVFYRLKSPQVALIVTAALQLLTLELASDGPMLATLSELLSAWGL